jgi:hypothetical protein
VDTLPDELNEAFAAAREAQPTPTELARLRSALEPMLQTPLLTAGAGTMSLSVKLGLGGLLSLLVAAAVLWSGRGGAPEAAPSSPTPEAHASAHPTAAPSSSASEEPLADEPASRRLLGESAPRTPSTEQAHATNIRPSQSIPRSAATRAPPSETELLDRAQAGLSTSPTRTLRLTRKHARLYPQGLLAQEREALAIRALLRLHRLGPARARLDAFARHWPRSAHLHGLRQATSEAADARPVRDAR